MKFVNYLKENKLIDIFLFVILVFIIFIISIAVKFIGGNSVSEYGDRLKGIEKVKIKKDATDKLIKEMKANDKVVDATYSLKGRRIDVILTFKDASVDEAKEIGNKVLDYFSDDEKKFYDIEVSLTTKEKNDEFPLIGYKHKTREAIVWD